jgi:hypothetical protein
MRDYIRVKEFEKEKERKMNELMAKELAAKNKKLDYKSSDDDRDVVYDGKNNEEPYSYKDIPPPKELYSSLASLASAIGGIGQEFGGGRKKLNPVGFNDNLRRAATPGGALEYDSRLTNDSDPTFLSRLKTPPGAVSNKFTPTAPSNIDAFVKKYSNQSPSNKHPQETKKLSSLEEQAHAYAQERAKERGYSENPNDVSFVSDSKLLQV